MAETLTAPEQEVITNPNEITVDGSKLNSFWGEQTPAPPAEPIKQEAATPPAETPAAPPAAPPEDEDEIIEPNEWMNREFGVDSADIIKAEREELKQLKSKPAIKFENEQSERMYELIRDGKVKEVIDILDKQQRINQFTSGNITDDNAGDVIKLAMKVKYGNLTDAEINYKYNKQYSLPKEPVREAEELEGDFEFRKQEWQDKVNDIKMSKLIDAKLAVPELEQSKAKIVLPEINKSQEQQKPPTQEELDAAKRFMDAYNLSVDNSIKNFNGVSVPVKNEVVDYTVTYGTTEEEKAAIASVMKGFAKENYDTNFLFAEMWIDDKNSLKVDDMVNDYYFLKNRAKILQKLANDSATKAIEQYVKGKKQINLNETTNPHITTPIVDEEKTGMDKVREQFFG